jgi:hypothetical protein
LPVESLIEREIRESVKAERISSLPLYHHGRPCQAPTAHRILEVSEDVGRHVEEQTVLYRSVTNDELTALQGTVLRRFGQSPAAYFTANKKDRSRD